MHSVPTADHPASAQLCAANQGSTTGVTSQGLRLRVPQTFLLHAHYHRRSLSQPSFAFPYPRSTRSSCILIPPATSLPWPALALQRPFGRTTMRVVSCAAQVHRLSMLTASRPRSAIRKAAAGSAGEPADSYRCTSARRRRRSIREQPVSHHAGDRAHRWRVCQR